MKSGRLQKIASGYFAIFRNAKDKIKLNNTRKRIMDEIDETDDAIADWNKLVNDARQLAMDFADIAVEYKGKITQLESELYVANSASGVTEKTTSEGLLDIQKQAVSDFWNWYWGGDPNMEPVDRYFKNGK